MQSQLNTANETATKLTIQLDSTVREKNRLQDDLLAQKRNQETDQKSLVDDFSAFVPSSPEKRTYYQ